MKMSVDPPTEPSLGIADTLGLNESDKSRRPAWLRTIVGVTIAIFAVFAISRLFGGGNDLPMYRTEQVVRGPLVVHISATGALAPLIQVEVGTEISGTVESVLVDFNQPVEKGQLLARINAERLEASTAQSRASLALAEAQRAEAEARVFEARSNLERLRRVFELSGGGVPTESELDSAQAAYDRAIANEAAAVAQIGQAQATLDGFLSDLRRARIEAPIDGIVLDRRVEAGQTVAASFQTPILFTLAGDLSEMELSVDVDEADVGLVVEGQAATFTVDAYPARSFSARVSEVRYAPRTVSGVVTYETILSVDNTELLLRPGMTATAEIVVNRVDEAILVPNAALRFTPSGWQPTDGDEVGEGLIGGLIPRPLGGTGRARDGTPRVWVLGDDEPEPLDLEVGASDGIWTVVTGSDLEVRDEVITDELEPIGS